jgi:hypothetical protein
VSGFTGEILYGFLSTRRKRDTTPYFHQTAVIKVFEAKEKAFETLANYCIIIASKRAVLTEQTIAEPVVILINVWPNEKFCN